MFELFKLFPRDFTISSELICVGLNLPRLDRLLFFVVLICSLCVSQT